MNSGKLLSAFYKYLPLVRNYTNFGGILPESTLGM